MKLVRVSNAASIRRFTPYQNRYKTAARVAYHVYMNRGKYARAAGAIGRAWRKYRARARTMNKFKRVAFKPAGFPRGSNTKKTAQVNDLAIQSIGTRTLNTVSMATISQTTSNALNGRQRDICFLSGLKICMEVSNQSTSQPIYFNIAVLTPRKLDVPNTDDFFRSNEGTDRGTDFDPQLSSVEFHCLPINVDEYSIQWHQRYRLAPKNGTESGKSYMNVDKYVPYKRQMRYPGTGSTPTTQQPFVVYWCDLYGTPSGGVAIPNQLEIQRKFVTFWREPRS